MHIVMSWLMLSVTALWRQRLINEIQEPNLHQQQQKTGFIKQKAQDKRYRAAAASWFLRLGELGSVDSALAESSSLLDDIEIVFRLDTTCALSSLD